MTQDTISERSPKSGTSYSWPVETSLHEVIEAEINTEYGGLSAQNSLSLSVTEYNGTVSLSGYGAGGDVSSVAMQVDPDTARDLSDALAAAADWADKRADSEQNQENV